MGAIKRFFLAFFSVYFTNYEPVPKEYEMFYRNQIPSDRRESLIKSYQQVFSEPPWNEKTWTEEEVAEKIEKDLSSETSFCALFLKEGEVKGFSWGDIVDSKDVPSRAARAMGVKEEEVKLSIPKGKTLYCDEFAINSDARSGINPVKFILRMFIAYGLAQEVKSTLFWSTPESKIVPLAIMTGYEKRGKAKMRDKSILFLYHPSNRLLISLTMIKDRTLKKIFRFLGGKRR
jgi:hypothetical protein